MRAIGAKSVLDATCGTGMHTLALSQAGFDAAGADLSARMIARAMENAQAVGLQIPFKTAGFGELSAAFGPESFDALFYLGNSLPHLLTPELLSAALADFAHRRQSQPELARNLATFLLNHTGTAEETRQRVLCLQDEYPANPPRTWNDELLDHVVLRVLEMPI
jgi:SAM-dependent methyltransferase